MNRSAWKLVGVALSSMWLAGFTAGGCFGDEIEPIDEEPSDECALLDEAACNQTPACVAIYEGPVSQRPLDDCACAPCHPDFDCPPCDCGGSPVVDFARCEQRPTEPVCPAIGCGMYCEYGNVIGADGCALCECNPGPQGCASITDEWRCIEAGCVPEYGGQGDYECPPCTPDGDCPGCAAPMPSGFVGCSEPTRADCWSDVDCPAGMFCAYVGAEAPSDCACACDEAGNCDCDCGGGTGGGAGGGGGMAPPAGVCLPYEPACFSDADCGDRGHCFDGLCYYDEPGCFSDADCAAGERCEYGAADPMPCECFCDPNTPDCRCGCTAPAPMGVCVWAESECYGDADCWGGYCEQGDAGGAAPDCADPDCGGLRAPGGYCVYPRCDDGSFAVCDMIPPECPAGQVTAVRDGCFACVDARSCEPVDPVCVQVVTYAADPQSGTCYAFATPCDVPAGWGACDR